MINGSNNPFSCEPVVFSASNTIVSLGTISRVGNVFTFSVGFVWRINGTTYQNAAPIVLTIAEATDGFNRIDNAILNTSNSIELQQGLESASVALQPIVPETNILLTSWNINGDSVDDQTTPILGTNFLKKQYENIQIVNNSDVNFSGNIILNTTGKNFIAFKAQDYNNIIGFSLENLDANTTSDYPHEGKEYFFKNSILNSLILQVGVDFSNIYFESYNGQNIIIPVGGIISFKFFQGRLQEVFRSWSGIDLSQKADLVSGIVPSYQLPSYVDDVIESANLAALPAVGESGKIYLTIDTGFVYRWSGTVYIQISDTPAVWGAIQGLVANQIDLLNFIKSLGLRTDIQDGNINSGNFNDEVLKANMNTNKAVFVIEVDGETNANGTKIIYGWANGGQGPLKFLCGSQEVMRLTSTLNIGIGTEEPNDSAILDLSSNTRGFLPPRMTQVEIYDINNPVPGLIVYDTEINMLQVFDGNFWRKLKFE